MKAVVRLALAEVALGGVLFGSAGRLDLPWFWGLLAVHAALMGLAVLTVDPGLRQERLRPGPGGKDYLLRWAAMPFFLAHLVIAGLDAGRYHWSGSVPVAVHVVGLIGYSLGMGLAVWAMAENRFFSSVVRLQAERGHHVISTGPYRFVRHPGYVGVVVGGLFSGVALGSWWSVLPILPVVVLFFRRLTLEDRFLQEELEGYKGYAARVRYRLVPGVW